MRKRAVAFKMFAVIPGSVRRPHKFNLWPGFLIKHEKQPLPIENARASRRGRQGRRCFVSQISGYALNYDRRDNLFSGILSLKTSYDFAALIFRGWQGHECRSLKTGDAYTLGSVSRLALFSLHSEKEKKSTEESNGEGWCRHPIPC